LNWIKNLWRQIIHVIKITWGYLHWLKLTLNPNMGNSLNFFVVINIVFLFWEKICNTITNIFGNFWENNNVNLNKQKFKNLKKKKKFIKLFKSQKWVGKEIAWSQQTYGQNLYSNVVKFFKNNWWPIKFEINNAKVLWNQTFWMSNMNLKFLITWM